MILGEFWFHITTKPCFHGDNFDPTPFMHFVHPSNGSHFVGLRGSSTLFPANFSLNQSITKLTRSVLKHDQPITVTVEGVSTNFGPKMS